MGCDVQILSACIEPSDGFDRMLRVESTRSFDNRRRRMVGCTRPNLRIQRSAADRVKRGVDHAAEPSFIDNDRLVKFVGIWVKIDSRTFSCLCGNENRDNRSVMARLVKILQVEPVVPHLIDGRPVERFLSNLEFDREYDRSHHENDIDASPHSRNVELEEDRS